MWATPASHNLYGSIAFFKDIGQCLYPFRTLSMIVNSGSVEYGVLDDI